MPQATFYFDLGSPYAYVAAERIDSLLAEPVGWQPLSLGGLFKLTGRSSWSLGDARRRQQGIAEIERRARAYALPVLRWPDPWPSNYLMAMRAATYAFAEGRGRDFTLLAFRAAFQHGHDLGVTNNVLDVAEHAGLDRREVEAAAHDPQVKRALREATEAAYALGVTGVPTVVVDGEPYWGDDRLQDVTARIESLPTDRH